MPKAREQTITGTLLFWLIIVILAFILVFVTSGCVSATKQVPAPVNVASPALMLPPLPTNLVKPQAVKVVPLVAPRFLSSVPLAVPGPKYWKVTFDVYPGLYDGTNGQCVVWGTTDMKTWVDVGHLPMIGQWMHCTNIVTNMFRDFRTSFSYQ